MNQRVHMFQLRIKATPCPSPSSIFSYKGKIPKASDRELKIRSHYSDSHLSKPLFSLSFTLELPRQKSGTRNSCQICSPSSSWVQPWTWTMCLREQRDSWQRQAVRTDLSARRRQLHCAFLSSYCRADAHSTACNNHCFEQAWRRAK